MEKKFGTRLAKFRKAKGLTQEDVGEKLGISAQAVSKWENDTTLPDPLMLKEIATLYGVTLNQIYGLEEETSVSLNKEKDMSNMILRVIIDTVKGDKVRVNLPISLIKVCLDSGINLPQFNGKEILQNIDLQQIMTLIEQGIEGNLVDITTADGDTVHVVVE